jgi:hypothetical protein
VRFAIALVGVAVLAWALWRSNRLGGALLATPGGEEPSLPVEPEPRSTTERSAS